jgi:hypothetical protein
MNQILLFSVMVAVSLTASCQRSIALKFSPLALIGDLSFPTIQAGTEYHFSKRCSWYNEFGIKYRRSVYDTGWDTLMAPSKGFKLKTELRYYLNKPLVSSLRKKKLSGNSPASYLAFNCFYTSDHRSNGVVYYYRRDSTQQQTDVFAASKKIYGFNFIIGKERTWGDHFGLDLYVGGGARFRMLNTSHQEFNPDLDRWITPVDLNIPTLVTQSEVNQRHDLTGNFSFGIRICYRL